MTTQTDAQPSDETRLGDPEGARLASVLPHPRQVRHQDREFYAFVHFGMNTMTDREWGLGNEDPAAFDPSSVDTDQWAASIAAAGMTGVILTAKHHDGFCLWPSAQTEHSVAASPWRGGRGDLVRELSDSARRHGLEFGVYLSPWDRTDARYGTGTDYDDYFVAQLRELLTGYGPVFSVWFDGANGEGPDGRRQEYDWQRYHRVIRELQPDAVIAVCGPDVRWCGNEAGHTRPDEWSVVPRRLQDAEGIADRSQRADDGEFARLVRSDDDDLGSRTALRGEDDLVWFPAEVNTSIRPGWFHHPTEDDQVRPASELFDIWCSAVGGNATFLLNVPPAADGLVAEPDRRTLVELGRSIEALRAARVAVVAEASSGNPPSRVVAVAGADGETAWRPDPEDDQPSLTLRFAAVETIDSVEVREDITHGHRLEHVRIVVVGDDGSESVAAEAHAVGRRRIIRIEPVRAAAVRVEVVATRALPYVSDVAVHRVRESRSGALDVS